MGGRDRGDTDGVDPPDELAVVRQRRDAQLGSHFVARFGARVDDSNQLTLFEPRIFLCVEPSEITDTDDCCSDFFHLAAIMPALNEPSLPASCAPPGHAPQPISRSDFCQRRPLQPLAQDASSRSS